jgi:AraC-like DNA-binding protein
MPIVISTSDVHPRDSLDYWMEFVAKDFVKVEVSAERTFNGRIVAGSIGQLGVSTFDCDPVTVNREREEICQADHDDYFICLQRTGQSCHLQGDREAVTREGDLFLLDPRHPFTGHSPTRVSMLMVRAPRQELEARTGPADAYISRTFNGQNPLTPLVFGFLSLLPGRVDLLDDTAAAMIAEQALDLVALALAADAEAANVTLSSRRAVTLTLLKSAIESRLHDAELRPAGAAAAAGISIRYANALLAEEDTGLERYIIDRRLQRCRRALEDPAQAHRMIGDIAYSWGFSDLSHFGRRFKAAFGCSPGDYRRQHAPQPCDAD